MVLIISFHLSPGLSSHDCRLISAGYRHPITAVAPDPRYGVPQAAFKPSAPTPSPSPIPHVQPVPGAGAGSEQVQRQMAAQLASVTGMNPHWALK